MPSSVVIYSPVPEFTIAGQSLTSGADLFVAARVEESVEGMSRCELTLDNWGLAGNEPGYLVTDRRVFDFGATLELKAGPSDERAVVFSGRLTGIEADYPGGAGPTITLLAEDVAQDMRMTRRTRTFEDQSDADIASTIADDHNLTSQVDLDGPTYRSVSQLNRSDLAFLRDRLQPLGVDVWIEGTTLHVGRSDAEPIVLRYGRELLSLRVLADVATQATEQVVTGWDPSAKEAVRESADHSSLGDELGDDLPGGRLLDEAFGSRSTTATLTGPVTSAQARVIAKGLNRDRARRFVTGRAVVDGLPLLRAGRTVELQDLGALFDGKYRACRVVHGFDRKHGYRTELDVERMGLSS